MRFSDIPGNEDIKRALVGMADGGRVPHALLFYENEGCGALALALAFFQYLNCSHHHDGDSCGECPTCNKVQKLIHPDLHFVFPVNSGSKVGASEKPTSESYLKYWRELVMADPYFLESELYTALGIEKKSGNIAVAEAKSIIAKLSLSSVEDGYKAVLVWLPEKMNAEAANRLLKIVEEPPQMTLFFFITHAPEKVLQTIFSRCQSLRVSPVVKEEVSRTLQSQFSVDKSLADVQSALSGGSVGVALNRMGDREEYKRYFEMFEGLLKASLSRDLLAALEVGEEIAALETREKQKGFCNFAGDCLRKIFMLKSGLEVIANVPQEEMSVFKDAAARCGGTFCQKAMGYFDQGAMLVERNVNPKVIFCDLVDRIFLTISK